MQTPLSIAIAALFFFFSSIFVPLEATAIERRGTKFGYICINPSQSIPDNIFLTKREINKAATKACDKIGAKKTIKGGFPLEYSATEYSVPGPYLEWPVGFKGLSSARKSPLRIVVDKNCEVIDVVTQFGDGTYEPCQAKWI
ncbi:hypothetical protein K3495_g13674 [Podosphaera aphanis]|nr:hypothetical protein K3495_g13674 [Podosphaera aphanis]